MKVSKSFMNFAESVVDSLEAVSEKIDEVQAKMDELQNTIDGTKSEDNTEASEDSTVVEKPAVKEDSEVEETEDVKEDSEVEETEDVKVDDEVTEKPEEGNFSYMVVKNLVAPFGNTVIKSTDFSEKKHQKIFNKTFSTVMQAQRMMSLYSTEGKNFSYRYKDVKNMLTL